MPNRQKFIGDAEALIELLNDMLSDAFLDEISEENESDFDVKTDLYILSRPSTIQPQ